ncbi:uncharacterized protein LOC111904405 [Lactuca sativa]|uniref:uncharacterized protein LOC111904405 n=1 Tax=Lactuca sativa TaxID=4236 RepID=UPI001C6896CE|nr:uncharacterized protein LOC111904405 [Lactuca sativa]
MHEGTCKAGSSGYYKCGRTGHMSRDRTATTTTTKTADLICFQYNQREHKQSQYPSLATAGKVVAPSPTTLRITDGRQGWAESPTVRCRAFQLTVKEARAAPNVVKAMIVPSEWYEFFQLRYDARGRRGFTTLQKCVTVIRLMVMGESPDTMDDYMRMSERTIRESLYTLSRGIVATFGDVYLRKPSLHYLQELYAVHEERHGFPGMIGSIDCTHWKWKNCPVAWKGQYASSYHESPLLVLEVVVSQDLWIWHAFFGVAGSNNDVNVLDQTPIFDDLLNGKTPDAPFMVNGNKYKYEYYIIDGIYPQYPHS